MLHAIEEEVILPADGKLPVRFQSAFGRKARVIVLLSDDSEMGNSDSDDSQRLMAFAGTINWPIEDVVTWQKNQRSEWDKAWNR